MARGETASPASEKRDSVKAVRIMNAAEQLILRHGFKGVTMTEIAARAHVGKGTAYLYWRTKESLFLDLLARGFERVVASASEQIQSDPELARPELLGPQLVRFASETPLVRAGLTSDPDLLGALVDDPRSQELVSQHGAAALLRDLLPIWRRHKVARTDWSPEPQAYALDLLLVGHLTAGVRGLQLPMGDQERDAALTQTLAAVLAPDDLSPEATRALAEDVLTALSRHRNLTG